MANQPATYFKVECKSAKCRKDVSLTGLIPESGLICRV